MKTRRVGSITCGCVLILFGLLFLGHLFVPGLSYRLIFHLWPLILILLGIELLAANRREGESPFKYDGGAVALLLALAAFAMLMGCAEFCMEHGGNYICF